MVQYSQENQIINREQKDRLFKIIFGRHENRAWTLSLYNAINGTDYDNPDDISNQTVYVETQGGGNYEYNNRI